FDHHREPEGGGGRCRLLRGAGGGEGRHRDPGAGQRRSLATLVAAAVQRSRRAARAATATKYSELVTTPATPAGPAIARATATTDSGSVVSARAASTPSSATQR